VVSQEGVLVVVFGDVNFFVITVSIIVIIVIIIISIIITDIVVPWL